MSRVIRVKAPAEPAPEGSHRAVVVAVTELGLQPRFGGEGEVFQYGVCLAFPEQKRTDGQIHRLWLTATESLHPKSTLGQITSAAALMPDIGEEFDPQRLVGANITVLINHVVKADGKTFANAVAYTKFTGTPYKLNGTTFEMPDWLVAKKNSRLDAETNF